MKKVKFFHKWALQLAVVVFMAMLPLGAAAEAGTNWCAGIAPPALNMAATSGATPEEKAAQTAIQAAALTDGVYANGNANSSWALRADYHYSETKPPSAAMDLGMARRVGKWVVTGASAYAAMVPVNFDIQYSVDGTTWETAAEVRGNANMTCEAAFPNVEAQYWRIVIRFQSKTSGEWSRITEIELYTGSDENTGTDTTTNWCLNVAPTLDKAATGGSTEAEKAAQRALQAGAMVNGKVESGNSNTSWTVRADYHKPQASASFDLGKTRKIGKWVVTGASSYPLNFPVNYDICYSADGSNYTAAAAVRNNANYENTTLFSNVEAQYWKLIIYFSGTASTEVYRISEVAMYGGEDVVIDVEKPQAAIVAPEHMTQMFEGDALLLSAQVRCETAEVERVSFYANGSFLVDAALDSGENLWKAAADLAAGEYFLTAKAITAKGGEAESESVRVRVHSENDTNIARGKTVTASPVKSADSNPDALVDGITDQATGSYKWYANANQASGAYAEIDLDDGFDNLFLLSTIKLYSGYASGGEQMGDFTLFYHNGEAWTEAITVNGNTQETYTYVFPSEIKASAVKLVSNQSVPFRVREMMVLGKLDNTKLSKNATEVTDGAGNEIRVLEKGTVVCAAAEIENTNESGSVDILSLIAVKGGNKKLLAAGSCFKTVDAGTSEQFTLQATIPQEGEVYCEVFWFDALSLEPLFPKNTIKSKIQKYSSDEVVVSVTANGFHVFVKGSDPYGTAYVQYPFRHIENAGINADLYRIYEAYAVDRTGDTSFVQTKPLPLFSNGELEFAVRELVDGAPADDFIGGYHGDENLTDVSLKIDGADIDLNKTGVYKGTRVEFVQNATMNKCGQPEAVAANHRKCYTIDRDGVKLDQTVDWLDTIILSDCYPCMFPVYRTDGTERVSEFVKYSAGGQDIIYDTRDDKPYYMPPTDNIFEAALYNVSGDFSAYVQYIPGEGLENHKFFFQVRATDNKVYFGANKGKTTKKGEQWEWTNIYKLDLK